MKKNEILKIYGKQYKQNTIALLEKAELFSLIPAKDARIAIKPNLVTAADPGLGATTHPEIVAGIIDYLKAHGFHELVIMEGSWVGDSTQRAFKACGYDRLSEDYGVPLLDLQKAEALTMDCAGMELCVCRPVTEVDFLINVPVLKGHCQTRITCALKNMKGLIPNPEKRRFHSLGLHKPIAHLSAGIRQDFIVVDHICGDLDFEDGGHPVVRNGILAGRDPVLMDALVCRMLHYRTEDVPYIGLAAGLGVGKDQIDQARIITLEGGEAGEGGEDLPLPDKLVLLEDAVEEVESCSACYGVLLSALDRLQQEGLFPDPAEKICIGQGFLGKRGRLGVGDCTCEFETSVAGCPPSVEDIVQTLKETWHGPGSDKLD